MELLCVKHKIRKARCKTCKGIEICQHDVLRDACRDCSKYRCENCAGCVVVDKNVDGKRLCHICNPYSFYNANFVKGRKEQIVFNYLSKYFPLIYSTGDYAPFRACGDNNRPDIVIICDKMLCFVEVDEYAHKTYEIEKEWKKLLQHSNSAIHTIGIEQVLFIRFNPDKWRDEKGETNNMKTRLENLRTLIYNRFDYQEKLLEVYHMYYPGEKIQQTEDHKLNIWIDYLRTPFEGFDNNI